jgi:hypothetical protein
MAASLRISIEKRCQAVSVHHSTPPSVSQAGVGVEWIRNHPTGASRNMAIYVLSPRLKWQPYRLRLSLTLLLFVCLLACAGCNRGPSIPRTVPVSGVVTLGGKPLAGAEVYFVNDKFVAFGKTDSQGKYELVQGAVAGENNVYFSKMQGGSSANPGFAVGEGMDEYQLSLASEGGGNKAKAPKQVVPPEYCDGNNPKLNFPVPSGGTTSADFKL